MYPDGSDNNKCLNLHFIGLSPTYCLKFLRALLFTTRSLTNIWHDIVADIDPCTSVSYACGKAVSFWGYGLHFLFLLLAWHHGILKWWLQINCNSLAHSIWQWIVYFLCSMPFYSFSHQWCWATTVHQWNASFLPCSTPKISMYDTLTF